MAVLLQKPEDKMRTSDARSPMPVSGRYPSSHRAVDGGWRSFLGGLLVVVFFSAGASAADVSGQPGWVKFEFIYETAPFPSCHASTIAETKSGLVAAWFGGTAEKNPDVGIWLSRQVEGRWTAPVEVANGLQSPEKRYPTWNPVLFQPRSGPLLLFFKVGPNPQEWWGERMTSTDDGRSWSKAVRLPEGILGPIKNKPVQLADGTILCPTSTEDPKTDLWRVHFERTAAGGKTWRGTPPGNEGESSGGI